MRSIRFIHPLNLGGSTNNVYFVGILSRHKKDYVNDKERKLRKSNS